MYATIHPTKNGRVAWNTGRRPVCASELHVSRMTDAIAVVELFRQMAEFLRHSSLELLLRVANQ